MPNPADESRGTESPTEGDSARLIECSYCDGTGEDEIGRCRHCAGTGREEIEVEPLELGDLSHLSRGAYCCTVCGHTEQHEREIICWRCGKGAMVWLEQEDVPREDQAE